VTTMLKINKNTFPMITREKSQQLRKTTELMRIKERIEREQQEEQHRYKHQIAEMFMAGPLAWPDFPDYEDVPFDEDEYEVWIPLDFDASSNGE